MFDRHYIGLFQEADFLEGYEQGKSVEEVSSQSSACKALATKRHDSNSEGIWIYSCIQNEGVASYKKRLAGEVLFFESEDMDISSTDKYETLTKDMAALVNHYAAKYGCHSLLQLNADDSRAGIAQLIPESMSYIGYSEEKELYDLDNLFLKLIEKKNGIVHLRSEEEHLPESDICVGGRLMVPIGFKDEVGYAVTGRGDLKTMVESAREMVLYICNTNFLRGSIDTSNEATYTALLEKDMIDTVLTWCHERLLIINKNKSHKGYVRFMNVCDLTAHERFGDYVDTDQLIAMLEDTKADNDKSFMVSNQTILDHHAVLTEETYIALREIEKAKSIVGDCKKVVLLQELVEPLPITKEVQASYPVIKPYDLPDNPFEFAFGDKSIVARDVDRFAPWAHVEEPAILVRADINWKPTYFTAKCGGIYVPALDVLALRVDTSKVKVEYLLNELTKEYVTSQLKAVYPKKWDSRYYAGDWFEKFVIDELLNMQILLPCSIEEQAQEVSGKTFGQEGMDQLYLRDFSSMPAHSAKEKKEPKDDPNQLSLF